MAGFETTRWSLILSASDEGDGQDARRALEQLCRAYRPAVLAWMRGRGIPRETAEDLTQGFFTRFLANRIYAVADPQRGRFRTLLRTALSNYLVNEAASAQTDKRRANQPAEQASLEGIAELAGGEQPDRSFERAWALTVLRRALRQLQREAAANGKAELMARLKPFVLEAPDADDYRRVAEETGMKPNTVAVATLRLRQRLRELVRAELAQTVATAAEADAEYADLLDMLAGVD
jgi:RNA polymerase sigma-70 factor (ECF subfamily)